MLIKLLLSLIMNFFDLFDDLSPLFVNFINFVLNNHCPMIMSVLILRAPETVKILHCVIGARLLLADEDDPFVVPLARALGHVVNKLSQRLDLGLLTLRLLLFN